MIYYYSLINLIQLSDEPRETVGSRSRFRQANSAQYAKLQQAAERQVMDYFKKGKGKRFGFKDVKHAVGVSFFSNFFIFFSFF